MKKKITRIMTAMVLANGINCNPICKCCNQRKCS